MSSPVDLSHLGKKELVEVLKAQDELSKRESKKSLVAFSGRNGFVPAAHHKLIIEHLEAVERGDIRNLLVVTPPGASKALALDTPIPTPTGWKLMGDLQVGDRVFDENGIPCNVTWVSPVHKDRPVYSVTTDCGDEIVADQDHEWLVRLCGKHKVFKIKETWQLARKRSKRPMIERAKALQLPDADLPIDPYLLGYWLGNGHSTGLRITCHEDDCDHVKGRIESLGHVVSESRRNGDSKGVTFSVIGMRSSFVKLGLLHDPLHKTYGRKHIPDVYLRSSVRQRMELLRGLIDSDGTVCKRKGSSTFGNTNLELSLQVRELVRSLGVKAGWSESRAMLNGKDCGACYQVSFYLKASASLPRKANLTRNQYRTPNTYIDAELLPRSMDTVCIEVDSPSHLFLAGESMTPTHNSTYSSILFPAWFLGRNPNKLVLAASNTLELAERFGRKVRQLVATEDYEDVFGIKLSSESAAAARWETDKGGEYFGVGVGGSVVGRRSDLLVLDDVVRSREDVESEGQRDKVWDWYNADILTRLKPNARQVFVNTRWHLDDLTGRILDRYGKDWTVLHLEMECTKEDDPLGRKIGERLWPEWFTDEMVERAKMDISTWNALYQGNPVPDGGGVFKKSWVEFYDNPPNPRHVSPIMLVDPATQVNRRSDYTAIWVIGVGGDDNYYVLDILRDKLNLSDRVDTIFRLHRKWKPRVVRYERYAMQTDIDHLKGEMDRRTYRFKIQEITRSGRVKKEDRIKRLIPYFKDSKLIFPRELRYTDYTGKTYDLVNTFIEEELAAFPVARHDDMIDALSQLSEPGLIIPRHVEPEERQAEMMTLESASFDPIDPTMGY